MGSGGTVIVNGFTILRVIAEYTVFILEYYHILHNLQIVVKLGTNTSACYPQENM